MIRRAFEQNALKTVDLLLGRLMLSTNPLRSMLLLQSLQNSPQCCDTSELLNSFLRLVPGADIRAKLFTCRCVLIHCFADFKKQRQFDSGLKEVDQFNFLQWGIQAPVINWFFRQKFSVAVRTAFQERNTPGIRLVLRALLKSTNPKWSMFLLKLLQDLPDEAAENSTELKGFLDASHVEGPDIRIRILSCRSILQRCFDGVEYEELNGWEPEAEAVAPCKPIGLHG
jgi:hypothetical protein